MADEIQTQTKRTHKDDLSVITVGSGVPGPSATRAEAMTMIQHKGRYIVLDCGYSTVNRLMTGNFDMGKIDMIMFTHFHLDHSCDFFSLMTYRYINGGRKLDIIGPPRTGDFYDFYKYFYRDDIIYRAQISRIETTAGVFKDVNIHEIKDSAKLKINDIDIESVDLIHTMYDLGYKFSFGDKTVVVSGDTSYTDKLVKLAKGTDMLVLDGSWIILAKMGAEMKDGFHTNTEKPGQRKIDGEVLLPMDYAGSFDVVSHFHYDDNIRVVSEIQPKKLIFTHLFSSFFGNSNPLNEEVKEQIETDLKKAGYTGEVHYAEDNLEVSV